MSLFDLSRFRAIAFDRVFVGCGTPDHPAEDEDAAHALLADPPSDDAATALAELTRAGFRCNKHTHLL